MALSYPRYVHGADGAHRLVASEDEKDAALADGFALEPILTEEQAANVKAAQIAAGELAADEAPADGGSKKKAKKKADESAE
jgi:hypothetical protein